MLTTNKRINGKAVKLTEEFMLKIRGLLNVAMISNQPVISYRLIADTLGVESKFTINAKSLDFVNSVAYAVETIAFEMFECRQCYKDINTYGADVPTFELFPVFVMGEKFPIIEFHSLEKANAEYFCNTSPSATKTSAKKILTPSEKVRKYLQKAIDDGFSKEEILQIVNAL